VGFSSEKSLSCNQPRIFISETFACSVFFTPESATSFFGIPLLSQEAGGGPFSGCGYDPQACMGRCPNTRGGRGGRPPRIFILCQRGEGAERGVLCKQGGSGTPSLPSERGFQTPLIPTPPHTSLMIPLALRPPFPAGRRLTTPDGRARSIPREHPTSYWAGSNFRYHDFKVHCFHCLIAPSLQAVPSPFFSGNQVGF